MDRRAFFQHALSLGLGLGGAAYVSGLHVRRADGAPPPLRPPGALPEPDFAATCIRCMRCVDACPNHALLPLAEGDPRGPAGTPTLSPRTAPCILCSSDPGSYLRCTEVCPSGALELVEKSRAMVQEKVRIGVAEVDTGLCYSYNNWSCGACFRACPLAGEAMTVGTWERPVVHAEACIGCGCCERACIRYPHAIRVRPREEGR